MPAFYSRRFIFYLRQILTYCFVSALLFSCSAVSQTSNKKVEDSGPRVVLAARMFDPATSKMIEHPVITINGDKVVSVSSNQQVPSGPNVIDLGDLTLLPGLIDAHTHIT